MTLAAILEHYRFVPIVPTSSPAMGTPESKALRHVPAVPIVPLQKRQGETDCATLRTRLLVLADAELIDAGLVHALPDADINACIGLSDEILRAYLCALNDGELRERGMRPPDETIAALCRHCGPIWLAPDVAKVAPVLNRLPRVFGCPWCHIKNRRAVRSIADEAVLTQPVTKEIHA